MMNFRILQEVRDLLSTKGTNLGWRWSHLKVEGKKSDFAEYKSRTKKRQSSQELCVGTATEKMVANEWQKPGYRLNPQHQLLCQHCKTNLIFLGSFFYIRLDDRVTKSAQRPEQPCCPSVKPSTRCILCGPSPIATGHGSVIGPSENRSQLTGLAASTL